MAGKSEKRTGKTNAKQNKSESLDVQDQGLSVGSSAPITRNPIALGIAAVALIALTIAFWSLTRGFLNGGSGDGFETKPPQVDRQGLSSHVTELLDDAYDSVERSPGQGSSWGLLGQAMFANGFRDEGAECFETARQLDAKDCRWPYFLGIYYEGTDNKKALELFLAAIELADYPDVIRMHLAETYFSEGQTEESLSTLAQLRETMNDYARLNLLEARIALQASDVDRAKMLAERAVGNEPDRPEIHALLAQIYRRLKDDARAQQEAELGAAESFGWPDYYVDDMMVFRRDIKYRVYLAENSNLELKGRIAIMREAVAEEPHVPGWHGRLANYLLEAGEFEEARRAIKRGVELHPDSAELYYIEGLISFFAEEYESAVVSFEKAIEHKPDYVEAHTNQGMTFRALDRLPEAIDAFREAVRYQPTDVVASYNLAFTLKQFGDLSGALAEYERLIGLGPAVPDPYVDAAELLMSVDENDKARDYLQRALTLEPSNERAILLLNQIPKRPS